jgi:DNA-binding transcriptional MocR family regulator
MLLLGLDTASRTPLHRQIVEQLQERIESVVLQPGERLPSTRRLAEQLGVHRSTVNLAYQQLWSLGYIDMCQGSRPVVRQRMQIATPAGRAAGGVIDWQAVTSPAGNQLLEHARGFRPISVQPEQETAATEISFASLEIDRRLFPHEQLRSCLGRVMAEQGGELLGYGDPAGYPPLRRYVARRMQQHGIWVEAGEVLLTNGCQHGIDLLLRLIAAPGRGVVLEAPTYDYLLPLLRFHGLTPLEVPLHADGIDLDRLEQMMRRQHPVLVYTMPSFHNPTGICTGQVHREQLLALCQTYRIPLLEDGFEEEMKYTGKVVLPVKSMDRDHLVVYCGTFSKVLFPGIRIGWVAADRQCIERLTALRRFSEVAPSSLLQAAVERFCRDGAYDRHVARMHRIFRRRMQVALQELQDRIDPAWATWDAPQGGYLIWLRLSRLPGGDDGPDQLAGLLAAHGVRAAAGSWFFSSPQADSYLRLSISALDEEEIAEGIKRLAGALRAVYV